MRQQQPANFKPWVQAFATQIALEETDSIILKEQR